MVTNNVQTANFIDSLKHWTSSALSKPEEIDARSCIQPVPGRC